VMRDVNHPVAQPSSPPVVAMIVAPPPSVTLPPPSIPVVAPEVSRAREESFLAALGGKPLYGPNHVSYASIPGSHGAYMGDPAAWTVGGPVTKHAYEACAVLDRYPNDLERATTTFYQELGASMNIDASAKQERVTYMEIVAIYLCEDRG
jgi:hypothetical protein